jgi:hypothetical protein
VTLPAPGDPRSIRYRYHFTDFRLGRLVSTLPMVGVQLSDVINGGASGSGTVPLSRQVIKRDPFAATITRRSICWAERQVIDAGQVAGSTFPWAGVVMKRTRAYAGRAMKLDMITLPGYMQRRLLLDHTFTQVDKFTIFRTLVSDAATQPTAGVYMAGSPHLAPLIPTAGPLSGILADRTYLASDLKPTLEALTALGNSGGAGFDWRFVPYLGTAGDLTTLAWRLDLGSPRLGRIAPPDLRWSTDRADRRQRWGFVTDLTVVEDGSAVNNRTTAVGSGTGPDQLRSTVNGVDVGRDEIASGYVLYEGSTGGASNDDRTIDTVRGKALGSLAAGFASEVQVSGIKVRGDLHPTLDSYMPGDDLTIRVGDAITAQPMTIIGQLVGRTITPPERGGTEQVTLDIQGTVAA